MFEPNKKCIASSMESMLSIQEKVNTNKNYYHIIPVALSNVNDMTSMTFLNIANWVKRR
jgi:hypothetical protein